MKISSFKFGETSLYAVDGVVTRGIILAKSSGRTKWAGRIFLFALIFFVATAAYTSGRSYFARFQYALGLYAVGQSVAASSKEAYIVETKPIPQLPLSPDIETSAAVLANTDQTPKATPIPKPKANVAASPVKIGSYISIGRLHIEAPVVETSLDMKAVNVDLQKGVIRWPNSVQPGEGGTTIILGHSSAPLSYRGKYGSVFALLDKLIPGDVITLKYKGELITYRVRDHVIIDPKKHQPDLAEGTGSESLVLVSCWPVGTNWQRIAVRAERVF